MKTVGAAGMFSLLGAISFNSNCGGAEDAPGVASRGGVSPRPVGFQGPFDLSFDASGNLFVSDPPGYRVVQVASSGEVAGSFGKPGSVVGRLNFPKGMAVGPDGLIYVVDSNNCRIQVFDRDGSVKHVTGSIGSIAGTFSTPQGVFVDGNKRLYVADTRNHRIQIFENDNVVGVIGDLGDANDQFRLPTACCVRPDGEILVLDSKHGLVKIFGPDFKFKASFGGVGSAAGQLNMPQGMDLDSAGNLWVADTGNHRIQQFSADGKHTTSLGKHGTGPGEFRSPTGIACRSNKIYVADNGNARIQILAA